MSDISLDNLLKLKEDVLVQLKQIDGTCEGIDNEINAKKINELNRECAKLTSDKNRLSAELVKIEAQLNKINKDITKLSGKGVEKILEAIKNQRWYFFKNKPKILFDKFTGYLWANLDYFQYVSSKEDRSVYIGKENVEKMAKELIIENFKGWKLPRKSDVQFLLEDKTFPFITGRNYEVFGYEECYVSDYTSINLTSNFPNSSHYYGIFMPYSKQVTFSDYKNDICVDNKIFTDTEKSMKSLEIFIRYGLNPIFNDEEVTELYRKIYIEKPLLLDKITEIQQQIDSLQQEVVLSSTFDYNTLLVKYDIKAINDSIIKYYEAVQLWINEIMDKLNYFEEAKGEIIRDFNIISLKLSRKYENDPNLTDKENALLKNRQNFFKKHFDIGMNRVKNKLLSIKKQADDIEDRIDEINDGDNALKELAILEKEGRATFKFIAENTATIIKNALLKIEYFEKNRVVATNIINLEDKWTDNYKVFKTTMKDELKNTCEEDSIEEELWSTWYEDWRKKRYIIEECFLPLVDKELKGCIAATNLSANSDEIASEVTIFEKIISLLETYKFDLDRFYLEERKNIYQKFAFQVGGDLQEKFETESETYKITSRLQKNLQEIIFSLDKSEDRIFLLRWANNLLDIQIDEILNFVKDKELSKISQDILIQFSDLKRKNYENFITDAKAYSEERSNREKQYNSLIFKMRKELMK